MLKEELQKLVEKVAGSSAALEHPENPEHGDYSTSVALVLGKKLGKDPREVAEEISLKLQTQSAKFLARIEVAGPGFINFFLKKDFFVQELQEIAKQKNTYGRGRSNKKIIIEYSSPNIAKPFGIGHLRSTIIGQAIYNLHKFLGYKCIGINYPGDWGTPHGKILYQLYRKKLSPSRLTVEDLEKLYIEFHREAETNPAMEEAARAWFKKLEDGDKKARTVWEQTRKVSFKEFARIYKLLGVKIDYVIGESFFEDKMGKIIEEFKQKGLARKSEGALIVPFPNDELPPGILLKSDGATTYFTRDLANIKYRVKRWKPNTIVIETGVEQLLHFKQVFLACKLAGYVDKQQLVHVYHGLYHSKEGKFSTRRGQTIHLEEVLKEAIERAQKLSPDKKIAKAVGIGAVKYNDLSQHPAGDIVFDWEKILNLKGNSGPYLQYTYARCKSIARKAGNSKFQIPNSKLQFSKEELDILRLVYRFSEVVKEAAEKFSPNLLCNFAFDLAQRYNLFYNTHRVLQAETKEAKGFRLLLTVAVAQLLKNSLLLLGIKTLERM